jgi:hypothetical protein
MRKPSLSFVKIPFNGLSSAIKCPTPAPSSGLLPLACRAGNGEWSSARVTTFLISLPHQLTYSKDPQMLWNRPQSVHPSPSKPAPPAPRSLQLKFTPPPKLPHKVSRTSLHRPPHLNKPRTLPPREKAQHSPSLPPKTQSQSQVHRHLNPLPPHTFPPHPLPLHTLLLQRFSQHLPSQAKKLQLHIPTTAAPPKAPRPMKLKPPPFPSVTPRKRPPPLSLES